MLIRFLRDIASFDFGYHAGQVEDIDDTLARAWCASGVAVEVSPVVPETAMRELAAEHAVKPRGKARGRR